MSPLFSIGRGNLLQSDVEALVNTVNCDGYMGKGIALQFKKAFPENFKAYQRACRAGDVRPGKMFVFEVGGITLPKLIINFPTKRHWREKSKLEDIKAGLIALVEEIRARNITSIAVPPLGCGLGGLDWKIVKPLIVEALASVANIRVIIFDPSSTPAAKSMPIGSKRPHLTIARALFIKLMDSYNQLNYRLTLLEIQKLAYFLQEAGEPLRLNYSAHLYGPYAHNLNKVLEVLEGHFISGYGDTQKPDVEIELTAGAIDEADIFLAHHQQSLARLERVTKTIEGFETPYGMELLASTHWIAIYGEEPAKNAEDAVKKIHSWNERKARMFKDDHIRKCWDRLVECGWIS